MQNRIRELRLKKGLSLPGLAKLVDTTHQQIMRLEKGERRLTVEWMTRLARALEVDPAELLPGNSLLRTQMVEEADLLAIYRDLEPSAKDVVRRVVDELRRAKSDNPAAESPEISEKSDVPFRKRGAHGSG